MEVFQKYGGKKQLVSTELHGCPQLRRQPEVTGVNTKCGVSPQGKRTLKYSVKDSQKDHFLYFGPGNQLKIFNFQGPVVRKVDSAIHRIVTFSTVVKMLEKLENSDHIELIINKTKLYLENTEP